MADCHYRNRSSLLVTQQRSINGPAQSVSYAEEVLTMLDLWRRLTVERLISESQVGYLGAIALALAERLSEMGADERGKLAIRIVQTKAVTVHSAIQP